MNLKTSADWPEIEADFLKKAESVPAASKDLKKISRNIQNLVSQLSREEITCRKLQKQTSKHAEMVKEINDQIEHFDQLITFVALIQNN